MRVFIDGGPEDFPTAVAELEKHGFTVARPIAGVLAPDSEVLWVDINHRQTAACKKIMPSLRYVCCPATGIDHIDMAGLNASGVKVLSLRDCMDDIRNVSATAELTLLLMLTMLRPMEGRQFGNELRGKRVLIVGCGRIGLQVWNICDTFGCELAVIEKESTYQKGNTNQLCEELSQADIVTLHVPLDESTEGMIGAAEMAFMKWGTILINTSRGKVVDEEVLIYYLRRGKLRAALDVHANEPGPPDPALVELAKDPQRLILTPHIGGYTRESRTATDRALVVCLLRQIEANGGDWHLTPDEANAIDTMTGKPPEGIAKLPMRGDCG